MVFFMFIPNPGQYLYQVILVPHFSLSVSSSATCHALWSHRQPFFLFFYYFFKFLNFLCVYICLGFKIFNFYLIFIFLVQTSCQSNFAFWPVFTETPEMIQDGLEFSPRWNGGGLGGLPFRFVYRMVFSIHFRRNGTKFITFDKNSVISDTM